MNARSDRVITVSLSPVGRLHVDEVAGTGSDGGNAGTATPPAARARIAEAFARGHGTGLLHLGAVEVATPLPPDLAFFRDLARLFMTRLCAMADIEEQRERVQVPAPLAELASLADSVPPMTGSEYVDRARLEALWSSIDEALREEIHRFSGTVQAWIASKDPAWNLVGRVCFHLAENRADEECPFAFLATYATRLSRQSKPQHLPLSRALEESSARGDRSALLSLLVPVQRASARSELLRGLLESRDLFHPLAWTPREAHRFLQDVPIFEESGVIVRVPDWWKARRPPRPTVEVRIGGARPATLGLDALLDFRVAVTLDGEEISEEEWRRLLASSDGLALVRGKWVEVDRERLKAVLDHWKAAERAARRDGISFLEGMRLLAGAQPGAEDDTAPAPDVAGWSRVTAGDWLASTLAALRSPEAQAAARPGPELRAALRPYQEVGVSWLHLLTSLGLGACLADDMGLGKTLQVLALLVLAKKRPRSGPHLLVVPASLIGNWLAEMERFVPSLRPLVAHPSAMPASELPELPRARLAEADLVITTYGYLHRMPWAAAADWDLVILDEAQAIKNPGAKQSRAVKALRSRARIALTGTPVENRLADLWSLFDFLNPSLLGSAKQFAAFVKALENRPHESYAPLRNLIRPYLLRRLKSDPRVVADLPDKTELRAYCGLTKEQAALYQRAVDELEQRLRSLGQGIERRGVVLAFLLRFKQICNHPSHWLGDGAWEPAQSGKFARLREIVEGVAAKQEKALVFTQFREATGPLATFLADGFGRPGLVLHGETPVRQRRELVERFQSDDGVPFFVLSVKAGGTGLNLTAASHVIHFDRWWNPAVEDQATDRAYRIGQKRNVLVHKLVCRGTVEEKIDAMLASKQDLSRRLLEAGGEALLTEMGDAELLRTVSLDLGRALHEA